jgi:hypothetical protein
MSSAAAVEAAPPILKGSKMAGAAIHSVRAGFSKLWPIWLLASVLSGATLIAGQATEVIRAHVHIPLWPERLAYDLLVSVGPTTVWCMGTRAILTRVRWWAMDRPLLEAAALLAGWNLFALLLGDGLTIVQQTVVPQLALVVDLMGLTAFVLQFWVGARLMLWPVGRLMAEHKMTPVRSWRLMRGAVWPYITGGIFVAVAPAIVGVILFGPYRHGGAVWHVAIASPFLGLGSLLTASLSAQLYRLRTGFPFHRSVDDDR